MEEERVEDEQEVRCRHLTWTGLSDHLGDLGRSGRFLGRCEIAARWQGAIDAAHEVTVQPETSQHKINTSTCGQCKQQGVRGKKTEAVVFSLNTKFKQTYSGFFGDGVFLSCEDFGKMFDHSFLAGVFCLFVCLSVRVKWRLARTHRFNQFLCEDQSTLAQRVETTVVECSLTSCM